MIKPKEALAPTLRAQHVHRQPSIPKRRRAAASQTRAKTQRGGTACQSRAHRFIAVGGQVTFASPHGLLPRDLHGEEKRQWRRERGGHERLEVGGSSGSNTTKHNHDRRHEYRRGGWCCPLPPRLEASHRHRGRRRRPNRSSPMAVRRSAGGARQPHWRKRAKVRRRDQRQGGVSTPRSWRRAKSLLACRSGGCWVAAGGDGARICWTLRSWQPCALQRLLRVQHACPPASPSPSASLDSENCGCGSWRASQRGVSLAPPSQHVPQGNAESPTSSLCLSFRGTVVHGPRNGLTGSRDNGACGLGGAGPCPGPDGRGCRAAEKARRTAIWTASP